MKSGHKDQILPFTALPMFESCLVSAYACASRKAVAQVTRLDVKTGREDLIVPFTALPKVQSR
jgi:hypothetical protein